MINFGVLIFILVTGILPVYGADAGEPLFLDPHQALSEHNTVRDKLNNGDYQNQPIPDPLLTHMLGDTSLTVSAQAHSNRCVWAHSSDRINTGENLFYTTSTAVEIDTAVRLWADEYAFYAFENNSCQPNEQCGHYTQLVWDESIAVGCAASRCTPLMTASGSTEAQSAVMITCQYKPAGNMIGRHPYDTDGTNVVFATYDSATQILDLPYFLVRYPDNLVVPFRVKLLLTGVSPVVFTVIDSELEQIGYDQSMRSPIYDVHTNRLFLPHVKVASGATSSQHSAVLDYIAGDGINLQLTAFE